MGRGEGHRFRQASDGKKKLHGICLIRKFPRASKNRGGGGGGGQGRAQDADSQARWKKPLSAAVVSLTQDIFAGANMNPGPLGTSTYRFLQGHWSRWRRQIRDLLGAGLSPYYRPQPFP